MYVVPRPPHTHACAHTQATATNIWRSCLLQSAFVLPTRMARSEHAVCNSICRDHPPLPAGPAPPTDPPRVPEEATKERPPLPLVFWAWTHEDDVIDAHMCVQRATCTPVYRAIYGTGACSFPALAASGVLLWRSACFGNERNPKESAYPKIYISVLLLRPGAAWFAFLASRSALDLPGETVFAEDQVGDTLPLRLARCHWPLPSKQQPPFCIANLSSGPKTTTLTCTCKKKTVLFRAGGPRGFSSSGTVHAVRRAYRAAPHKLLWQRCGCGYPARRSDFGQRVHFRRVQSQPATRLVRW